MRKLFAFACLLFACLNLTAQSTVKTTTKTVTTSAVYHTPTDHDFVVLSFYVRDCEKSVAKFRDEFGRNCPVYVSKNDVVFYCHWNPYEGKWEFKSPFDESIVVL